MTFTIGSTAKSKNVNWKGGRPKLVCRVCGKSFLGYLHRRAKYCSRQCCGIAKIGKSLNLSNRIEKYGKDHHSWKGDNARIDAIHHWVVSIKGHPTKCEYCNKKNLKAKDGRRLIHWANIDHKYNRNLDDFIALCISCHRKYDKSYLNLHPHLKSLSRPSTKNTN